MGGLGGEARGELAGAQGADGPRRAAVSFPVLPPGALHAPLADRAFVLLHFRRMLAQQQQKAAEKAS